MADNNSKPKTKTEIYTYIAEQTDLKKKDVSEVFVALAELMGSELKNGPGAFTVPGLMKVKAVHKPAMPERKGINPFTGEEAMFKAKPARNVIKVTALKALKDMV
ncbi:MAG TPA: DNA-binding protein [Acidiferrobacteraceae bacterium]|nr:DNA-binding protein [Acidiferrobacteraceae bacterium]